MGLLQIGQSWIIESDYYTTALEVREILREKGFDFQFKLGKGILTVRRTQ